MRPEIVEFDQIAPGQQGLTMQWAAIALMPGFDTVANRREAWLPFTGRLDELGIPRKEFDDDAYVWDYVMRGQIEEAVDHYLDHGLGRRWRITWTATEKCTPPFSAPFMKIRAWLPG